MSREGPLPIFGPAPPPTPSSSSNSPTTNNASIVNPAIGNATTSQSIASSSSSTSRQLSGSSPQQHSNSLAPSHNVLNQRPVGNQQAPPPPGQQQSIRPYRSRRNRPCDFCRRRKTRCDMLPEGICAMCKKVNGHCTFVAQPAKKKKIEGDSPGKPVPASRIASASNISVGTPSSSNNHGSTANVSGKIKINNGSTTSIGATTKAAKVPVPKKPLPPVIDVPPFQQPPKRVDEDKEPPLVPEGFDSAALLGMSGDQDPFLLQYYNYDENENCTFIKHAVRRVGANPAFPVQFLAYKDNEKDVNIESEIANQRKRIFNKVNNLEERLLALYFRFAYPTYPIVDRESFYHDYYHNKDNINVGVLAGLLALSCIWWKYDSLLCVNVMPKNLSEDLYEECAIAVKREAKHPSIASVQCLLLLLQRRLQPSDNAETFELTVDIAKLVAISHNLGLHLDSSDWSIAPSAKRLRKRLWTTVYIMEKWTTMNVGRPSMLNWNNSTVTEYNSEEPSAQLFVQMCRLTVLLDDIRQDLYSIRRQHERMLPENQQQVFQRVGYYFAKLEDWKDQLPEDLKDMQVAPQGEFCKNGTLNLAALTVEALLHKVRLHATCNTDLVSKDELIEFRQHAEETIQRVIKFTSEITHSHLHAFWYSTTRLNFSTVAHFMYFHHITSPTRQEYRDTREILRKWLFALRVLTQGWEEGTGLATLRMDTVFWMGNDLFNDKTPGLNGEMEPEFEDQQPEIPASYAAAPAAQPHPPHQRAAAGSNNHSTQIGPVNNHQNQLGGSQFHPHMHSHQSNNHQHQHQQHAQLQQHHHHHQNHHHNHNQQQHQNHPRQQPQQYSNQSQPYIQDPDLANMTFYHPINHDYPISTQPEPLDHDHEDMLLLNEDIMPQEEQSHLLQEDVPDNLEEAYAEYFSDDRFHDEGFLTQDLHELFQVHTNSGLTPDSTFV